MFGLVTKKKYEDMKKVYEDSIRYHKESKHFFGTKLDDVIKCLDRYKKANPNAKIIMETKNGTVEVEIGDALIYETIGHEIMIDAE